MKQHIGLNVADLRPTQMTIGRLEVEVKQEAWRSAKPAKRDDLLRSHVIPAVIGPKKRHYIIDHHHFALAVLMEGGADVAVFVRADLSNLPKDEFWTFLDNNAWCHAYDSTGRRRSLTAIPKKLDKLSDDPFRSLVNAVIRSGGCAKSDTPYFEFVWADFLRRRLKLSLIERDYASAVQEAVALARSNEACHLPGWCAGHPDQTMA